jgi:hypothetical protein
MKDTAEVNESHEKQLTKIPEKNVATFDDLKNYHGDNRIETFDDLEKTESGSSIRTFNDLRTHTESGDSAATDTTGKSAKDTPGEVEQKKIDRAAGDIKKIDWMTQEKWKNLNPDEKRVALEHSGKALGKAYDHPEPPLTTKKMGDPDLQGTNGDGYSYRPESRYSDEHGVAGADYRITMNQDGADPNTNKKLFGDDPRQAVETYGHEFRHSYQHEQAQRYEKGFKVDDPDKAKAWSENFGDYKQPPDSELAKSDPEKYVQEYNAYRNQPVEIDANDFGKKLSSSIYGDNDK